MLNHLLRQAKQSVLKKMSFEERAGLALLSILRSPSLFTKKGQTVEKQDAYSRQEINRLVEEFLLDHGIEDPPDIEWAVPILGTVRKLAQKFQWSNQVKNDILAAVLEDTVMGWNFDTSNPLEGAGNIAEWVQDLRKEGKSDTDIKHLLGNMIAKKARQKWKKLYQDQVFNQETQSLEQGVDFEEDASGEKLDSLAEEILDPGSTDNPLLDGGVSQTMSLLEESPRLQKMLRDIDEQLESQADESDWGMRKYLVWKAYLQHLPRILSKEDKMGDLPDREVEYRDPETGKKRREKLEKALERTGTTNIYYIMEKFREDLKKMYSTISQYLP